jgi:hypothetical protein
MAYDPKEQIVLEEVSSLMDSFENKKHSMAAVLDMAVGIGCKLKADDNNCIGCPLTSYLCREIRERIKELMIDDEEDDNNE